MSASKRRKKKGRIIIFAIEIILLLAALAALFVWSKYQKLDRQPDMIGTEDIMNEDCLLYTSPSPRDYAASRLAGCG